MSDLIDVLSESGLRTGDVLPRAEIHRLGKHHRAVHVYLFNARNEVLLQKRAPTVDHFPGLFGISVTGHVQAGEFSAAAARRELKEELGLRSEQRSLDFVFSFYQEAIIGETYIDRQFNDVYVVRADIDPDRLVYDRSEVSEVKFVPFERFQRMASDSSSELAPVYARECRDLAYFLGDVLGRESPRGVSS